MAAAAVAAVEGMTRALALDLAPIRVNAVAPGLIDAPLDSFAQRKRSRARGRVAGRANRLPGRSGRGGDLPMSNGLVTGAVLPSTAGQTGLINIAWGGQKTGRIRSAKPLAYVK